MKRYRSKSRARSKKSKPKSTTRSRSKGYGGCKPGQIRRKSYTKKDGTYVPSTCIADKGRPGKGRKILPKPTKGALSQFGYHNIKHMNKSQRREALQQAIDEKGFREVIGHLVLVTNYNKRSDPEAYKRMKDDQEWVSKQYDRYKEKYGVQRSVKSRSRSKTRRTQKTCRKLRMSKSKSKRYNK